MWPGMTRPKHYRAPGVLIALALFSTVYGLAYIVGGITDDEGTGLQLITIRGTVLPSEIYGVMWLAIGSACMAGMWSRRVFAIAYPALSAAMGGWSLLYLVLWTLEPGRYGLLTSALWWAVFALAVLRLATHERTVVKINAANRDLAENEVP